MASVIPMQADVDKHTGQLIYKAVASSAGFEVKVVSNEDRVLRFIISKEIRDRDGDIVRQRGIDTTNYQKNPVVFWGHQSWSFPIAKTIKLKKEKGADGVMVTWAEAQFASLAEQGHGEAELAFALCRDGYVNAASQGFRIVSWKQLADSLLTEDELTARNAGRWISGIDIVTSELYEWSPVGIPANPGAEIQRAGLVGSPDWPVKRVLDLAREKLGNGEPLERFRRSILGTEDPICVGCVPADKAPERVRSLLAAALPSAVEDDGFDLTAKSSAPESVGQPTEKAGEPEPAAAKGDEPVPAGGGKTFTEAEMREAFRRREKLTDPEASALETRLSALAGSIGALAGILEATVSRLTAACASMEACCARMESAAEPPEPDEGDAPMTMASFAAEVRKGLVDTRRYVEDSYVTIWKQVEADKASALNTKSCGCTKAAPASSEATADPAPVAKDAEPAGSAAAPPNPAMDAGLMERVLRAGFTAGREKHLGIVRI